MHKTIEDNLELAHDKFWVPKGSVKRWQMYWDSTDHMRLAVKCIPKGKRKTVVQAGGNIGAFPMWLSSRFEKVLSFEPEPTNFACLEMNTRELKNVEVFKGALGDTAGRFDMCFVDKGIGSHYMTDSPGHTKVWRIDDLELTDVCYLMLDVEGFELPALRGAEKTIRRDRPIIQVEDKGNGLLKGRGDTLADILAFLGDYKILDRVHYDVVLVPNEWSADV